MNVLVVDIGGTNVKILATGETEARKTPSGPLMTPERMVVDVMKLASDWKYDVVSIGYPGRIHQGQIVADPHNLAAGWVPRLNFEAAFGRPTKLLNDAAMQALGSYSGSGLLLFLGFGTGLGSALVADGIVVPMELAHLPYSKGTFEDYVGLRGIDRLGKKKWRQHIAVMVARLIDALHPDDIVLGGGNAKKLNELPLGCRLGNNANAFLGGFRMWESRNGMPT